MLRLTTLGAIDLRDRLGHPVRDVLAQPKRVALLAYLVVESRRGPVARDSLLALFWPESDTARARNALSQALHHLRQALGAEVIESRGANAVSVVSEALWCDATAFADALERKEVELALDLYRGEFCPALFGRGAPELEQWLDGHRRELRSRALSAARTLAEEMIAAGDRPGAARAARRALAMQPDDEGDVRALLSLLEGAGDRPGALLAYHEYERRLAELLETEPTAETRRLVEAIRTRRDLAGPIPVEEPITAASQQPPSAPPVAAPPAAPRRRRFLLPALALVLIAVAGVLALRRRDAVAAVPPVRTLAVFPFQLRGGAPLGYLADGMVDLMSAKLDGTTGIRAIDPRSVLSAVARSSAGEPLDVETSARIAKGLGAGWYITGDVLEVAGRLQINESLVDVQNGSQVVATATVSGDTASLFELVDDLAGRMLARLSMGRDSGLVQLAAVTTHSLPALQHYLAGERALRAGHDAQAAAAFREAATLDTGFALAQYRLALTATWVHVAEVENPTVWATKAASHAQRLTPLARDLLTAYGAYKELRGKEAERLYRGVTEGHPDNVEAWFMLGETLFHLNSWRGRSPMEAWAPFQRVLALDPTNGHAMVHLARLAVSEGRLSDLDSLVSHYLERYPDAERALEMRALQAYVTDDPAARKPITAAARETNDFVLMSMFQAATLYAQNLDAARELAQPLAQSAGTSLNRQVGRWLLTDLALAGGQWRGTRQPQAHWLGLAIDNDWRLEGEALLAAEPLLQLPTARVAALRDSIAARRPYRLMGPPTLTGGPDLSGQMQSYLLGLLSVRLGDTAAATRYAAGLAAVREAPKAGPSQDLARGLRAEIARSRGDFEQALTELKGFTFDVSTPGFTALAHWSVHERFLKAELLRGLGRDEEALPWYDSFQGPYDLPYIALTHLRRGQIFAHRGDRERANFHFSRMLSMWRAADPELQPLVALARAGLSVGTN